jgi:hypothetical protein
VVRIVVHFGGMSVRDFTGRSMFFDNAWLLVVGEGIVMRRFVVKRFVRGFFDVSFARVIFFMLMRGSGVA